LRVADLAQRDFKIQLRFLDLQLALRGRARIVEHGVCVLHAVGEDLVVFFYLFVVLANDDREFAFRDLALRLQVLVELLLQELVIGSDPFLSGFLFEL
jgi:hypothetical protein